MIVVKIELHPASGGRPKLIGKALIVNDGTSTTPKRGNYNVFVGRRDDLGNIRGNPARTGRIENFPRLSYNVWRLVLRSIRSAFLEER